MLTIKSFVNFITNRFTIFGILLTALFLSFPFGRLFRLSSFGGNSLTIQATLSESFESIAELNTLRVSMAGVVSAKDESFWGDNNVLIVAQGYAVYGVDLSHSHVEVNENEVVIFVPTPTMNEAYIDMQDSYVYENEMTGLRMHDKDSDLLNKTWNDAQQKIVDLSTEPRNLNMAKTNLNTIIKGMVEPHIGERTLRIEYSKTTLAMETK